MTDFNARHSRTCRFCRAQGWTWDMIKYGSRAYAHPDCYVKRAAAKDVAFLPLTEQLKLKTLLIDQEAERLP